MVQKLVQADKRARSAIQCRQPTEILIFMSVAGGSNNIAEANVEQALSCYIYLGSLLSQPNVAGRITLGHPFLRKTSDVEEFTGRVQSALGSMGIIAFVP